MHTERNAPLNHLNSASIMMHIQTKKNLKKNSIYQLQLSYKNVTVITNAKIFYS